MCILCDGTTDEESRARTRRTIEELGWQLMAVGFDGDGDGSPPWMYTVGLLESFDHPELVIAGDVPVNLAAQVLNALGTGIKDEGKSYRGGDRLESRQGPFLLRRVHPAHYRRTTRFAYWTRYYEGLVGVEVPKHEAVQVVIPAGLFCPDHRRPQVNLSLPPAMGRTNALRSTRAQRRGR